jgi:hypothetical protein
MHVIGQSIRVFSLFFIVCVFLFSSEKKHTLSFLSSQNIKLNVKRIAVKCKSLVANQQAIRPVVVVDKREKRKSANRYRKKKEKS